MFVVFVRFFRVWIDVYFGDYKCLLIGFWFGFYESAIN